MDGVASGLTFLTAGLNVTKATKRCFDDYRDAPRQILCAQQQGQQFELNQELMNELSSLQKERISPAQISLQDAYASLLKDLPLKRRGSRVKWALGRKRDIEGRITRCNQIENSMVLNLVIALYQEWQKELLNSHNRNKTCSQSLATKQYVRERTAADTYLWDWLSQTIGIRTGVIISKLKPKRTRFFARWSLKLPFRLSQAVTGHLVFRHCFLTIPKVMIRPQNAIPPGSMIIKACQTRDTAQIKELLRCKEAHPNDRTPDDLTVFRFGIPNVDLEIVQMLLEHGADPNLAFGKYDTSPLNNAFFIGNVFIIRLLLNAGAEVDYQNSRTWTSLSFLWDPIRPVHTSTSEILEICVEQGFFAWNDPDIRGWSAVHRAAAYGCYDDIRNLEYKGANLQTYTTDHLWGPITCAVWNSNISTFNALTEILPIEEVLATRDTRGWTLLHFAAQNGCEHILRTLWRGIDHQALTIGTRAWVTEGLEMKNLTAEMIAREYGHGELWTKVIGGID